MRGGCLPETDHRGRLRTVMRAYGDVIEDRFPGCGPLGGIHAALCATQSDLNLIFGGYAADDCRISCWLVQLRQSGEDIGVRAASPAAACSRSAPSIARRTCR